MFSTLQQRKRELVSHQKFGELIPVLHYYTEEQLFLLDPATLGFMIICQPLNGVSVEMSNLMRSIFTYEYPDDTTMVISTVGTRDMIRVNNQWDALRGGRMEPQDWEFESLLNSLSRDYLVSACQEGLRPGMSTLNSRNFEVWYSVSIPINNQVPTDAEVARVVEIKSDLVQKLRSMGGAPMVADHEQWLRRMQVLMNPGQNTAWARGKTHIKPSVPLRHQILQPGRMVSIDGDGVVLVGDPKQPDENRSVRILNCYRRPDYANLGDMYGFYSDWATGMGGIHNDFMLSLNIHFPNRKKAKNAFDTRKVVVTNQESAGVMRYSNRLRYQFEDIKAINHELEQENHAIVNCWLQLALFLDKNGREDAAEKSVISYLDKIGYGYAVDRQIAMPLLLETLPLCHGYDPQIRSMLQRQEMFTTKYLEKVAPVFGPWKGNSQNPVIVGYSREGQIITIDPFKTNASFNMAIAARSGAGKSVFAGNLVKQLLTTGEPGAFGSQDGGQVFVIDSGGSYKSLSGQFQSSQYIEFSEQQMFSLDPFVDLSGLLDDEDAVLSDDPSGNTRYVTLAGGLKLTMITNQIKLMAAPDGKIDNFQSAAISRILLDMCVSNPENASITFFAERCLAEEDQRIRDIGAQLHDFTRNGKYARLFDRRLAPTIQFDSRLIVCELGQLKAQPHLQTVVLMSVIQQAQDAMFQKDDGRRRAFILDEAWEYIGEGSATSNNAFFAEFIEAGWRRFRKTQAMGVCITQQVSDYYSSKTGKAIFANSPWLCTLAQEGQVISRLKNDKLMDAPQFAFNLMESVRTDKGQFSEILVQYEGIYQVMRLYVDDRSMTIHTTDPEEKKIIAKYTSMGMSLRDAVIHATDDIKRMRR
ncbi:TraC family protein [Aeromonas veronii]|uniref:TraC family protein n=1 Tax=Aeromonas veronii TaxID=654 RepID=UPI000E08FFDA|nr:TraC family protein [Aeromonas veronii]RDE61079.1 hypothetical protein DV708_17430 [Aeromonas veronii]